MLTVYGIETIFVTINNPNKIKYVATVLTVYGIETFYIHDLRKIMS